MFCKFKSAKHESFLISENIEEGVFHLGVLFLLGDRLDIRHHPPQPVKGNVQLLHPVSLLCVRRLPSVLRHPCRSGAQSLLTLLRKDQVSFFGISFQLWNVAVNASHSIKKGPSFVHWPFQSAIMAIAMDWGEHSSTFFLQLIICLWLSIIFCLQQFESATMAIDESIVCIQSRPHTQGRCPRQQDFRKSVFNFFFFRKSSL